MWNFHVKVKSICVWWNDVSVEDTTSSAPPGQQSDASWCWRLLFKNHLHPLTGGGSLYWILVCYLWRKVIWYLRVLFYHHRLGYSGLLKSQFFFLFILTMFYLHLLLQALMMITDKASRLLHLHLSRKLTFCVILYFESTDNGPLA